MEFHEVSNWVLTVATFVGALTTVFAFLKWVLPGIRNLMKRFDFFDEQQKRMNEMKEKQSAYNKTIFSILNKLVQENPGAKKEFEEFLVESATTL